MTPFLIALTTATALIVIPLAIVAIGIHRQEHAPSLATRPPGVAAALTRKLLALHATPEPEPASAPAPARATRQPSSASARRAASIRSTVTPAQARP